LLVLKGEHRLGQCRRRLQSRQFEPNGVGTVEFGPDKAARIGGRIEEIARGAAARAKSETIERHQRCVRIAGHGNFLNDFSETVQRCDAGTIML
jgi:hypothetical protein